MSNLSKVLKWIGLSISIILTTVFLVGAIMVSRSLGFGMHACIYLVISLLFFLLAGYLVKKI